MSTADTADYSPPASPADLPANTNPTLGDVLAQRLGRRDLIRGGLATSVLAAVGPGLLASCDRLVSTSEFDFKEVSHGTSIDHVVPEGYDARVLLRWGDPLFPGMTPFTPDSLTADEQERRFGYNNDYIAFIPLAGDQSRGILCVNHEYTVPALMFAGDAATPEERRARADIELAAMGISLVEIARRDGAWHPVLDSRFNRRISARSTDFTLSGPVAGHARVSTSADPFGKTVRGTLNNCAGGVTPWRTFLSGEENFDKYFNAKADIAATERANHANYGIGKAETAFWQVHDRFNVDREPNEANRFGWVVEVDPLDPASVPVKRTALGRLKHEGAEVIVNRDGRVVVYCGDDEKDQCLYRFVSRHPYDRENRAANMDLLDDGVLSAARFDPDGTLTWLPLRFGRGPLLPPMGFTSQADVLIEARRAAGLSGATPMDRPEGVKPHPSNGRIYVMLTGNEDRTPDRLDPANPRENNRDGHILELTAPDGDHTAARYDWNILALCGDPQSQIIGARWNPATTANGWFSCPDNCTFDARGRLWVATDQGKNWDRTLTADGLYAVDVAAGARGTGRMFYRVPVGAELCGPCFVGKDTSLFVSVQHPGADLAPEPTLNVPPQFQGKVNYARPATRWPDFSESLPPRPSVVVITRKDGGPVGG